MGLSPHAVSLWKGTAAPPGALLSFLTSESVPTSPVGTVWGMQTPARLLGACLEPESHRHLRRPGRDCESWSGTPLDPRDTVGAPGRDLTMEASPCRQLLSGLFLLPTSSLFDGQLIYLLILLGLPPARQGAHERTDGPRHAASCESKALFSLCVSSA